MSSRKTKYTDEILDFIRENVKQHTDKEIAEMINDRWGWNTTYNGIRGAKSMFGIKSGVKRGTFVKGQTSWNKGKRMETRGRMAETQFKKGQPPINHKPVGSERVNVYGYLEIKVAEPNIWESKHRVIWEQHNGPIPPRHKIIFLDGDKSNLNIDNLALITNAQSVMLNKYGLIKNDAELTKTGVNLAELILTINRRKRGAKQ